MMARHAENKQSPAYAPDVSPTRALALTQMQGEMRQLDEDTEARVTALATKLGYDGALTVGGLEDEIRFYQRQTVESMLQVGKRLLVLKEITPHGEFEPRVELLGFSVSTAQRFMSAATKAKSPTVGDLAGRVKNGKAYLELITHDDGVIKQLADMDEFDKMSASQLRAAARELQKEDAARVQVSADKSAEIERLRHKLAGKKVVAATDWPLAFSVLMDQAAGAGKDLHKAIHALTAVYRAGYQAQTAGEHEAESLEIAQKALAEPMQAVFSKGLKSLYDSALLFDKTLGAHTEGVVYPS